MSEIFPSSSVLSSAILSLLSGRSVSSFTPRTLRTALEEYFSLPPGSLADRNSEIKELVAEAHQINERKSREIETEKNSHKNESNEQNYSFNEISSNSLKRKFVESENFSREIPLADRTNSIKQNFSKNFNQKFQRPNYEENFIEKPSNEIKLSNENNLKFRQIKSEPAAFASSPGWKIEENNFRMKNENEQSNQILNKFPSFIGDSRGQNFSSEISTSPAVDSSEFLDLSGDGSGLRRLTVSRFTGRPRVDIREFYEDKNDGKLKPGKKGISLTEEQFQIIIQAREIILKKLENIKDYKGNDNGGKNKWRK